MIFMIKNDVEKKKISLSAQITGQTLIEGKDTCIEAGAVIENSYLKNVTIKAGAKIIDSVITGISKKDVKINAEEKNFKSKWQINDGNPVVIGKDSVIISSTLDGTSIGDRTKCNNSAVYISRIGHDKILKDVYINDYSTL